MKFLFTTLPSNDLGLLTRSLPIARELHARGHRILFCSPAKAPGKLIADAGFDNLLPSEPLYYLVSADTQPSTLLRFLKAGNLGRNLGLLTSFLRRYLQASTAEIWNIDHFMYLFGTWNDTFVRLMTEGLIDLINEHQPDAIVDFWNPFACLAARATRIPLISVIQADMHPASAGFIWWKAPPPAGVPTGVPALNRARAGFGLPPIQKAGELTLGDLTLVVGIPELDPLPPDTPVTYLGPVLWQKTGASLPDWVNALRTDQPLIWVYSGNPRYAPGIRTAFDSGILLQATIEALKNEPVQVVLTTGHHALPRKYQPLPANFHYAPYLPGLAMAERSDLLIHHGGYGSCQTGLYTGTPALIIPTYSERESNARRIAAVGAGEFLIPEMDPTGQKKSLNPEILRAKVKHLLATPDYKQNAIVIREKLRGYGGATVAAQLIETLLLRKD